MRPPKTLAALATTVAVAAGAAAIAPAANASVGDYHTYRITTAASLALDVSGGSMGNAAPVIQWPINGGRNQQWRTEPTSDYPYQRLRNVNSGKCLTLPFQGSPGTGLQQYTCQNGAANQEWSIDEDSQSPDFGSIIYSGLQNGTTVDVPGGTIAWGTQLINWPLHHGINQAFHFTQLD